MRTRRRTAEVLLSRPLPQSKPSAAAALPFPLLWAFHGRPLSETISCVLAHHSARRRARRLPPDRARRVSLLSPVGNVVEPGSRAVERDEGQSFGHNLCGSVPPCVKAPPGLRHVPRWRHDFRGRKRAGPSPGARLAINRGIRHQMKIEAVCTRVTSRPYTNARGVTTTYFDAMWMSPPWPRCACCP